MLTLSLNNQIIPVPRDFSIRLTWKSPVCNFERIPTGFGLDFSIPTNDYTRPIFGNPQRFSKLRIGNDQEFPGFEVRFGGALMMAGTLKITGTKKNAYECSLIDQVGVLSKTEQERYLLDIDTFSEPVPWVNRMDYSPDNSPYCCFPVQNTNFFDDKGVSIKRTERVPDPDRPGKEKDLSYETEVLRYLFNKTTKSAVNARDLLGDVKQIADDISITGLKQKNNTYEESQVTVISPFFYLNYVIREALKANGIHIVANKLDDDSILRKLCIYNNYDITNNTFGTISDYIEYYEGWAQPWELEGLPDNVSSAGARIISYIRSYGADVVPRNHLPKMKLGDTLLSTQNLLNLCFHFLPNDTVKILSREDIITGSAADIDRYFLGEWEIDEKKQTTIKFVRDRDDKDLVFSERFSDLSDRRADIKAPVETYAELVALASPELGEIRFVSEVSAFYEYKWITNSDTDSETKSQDYNDVLGWEKTSIGLQDGYYEFGREEEEEIKTSWSPCWGFSPDGTPEKHSAIIQQKGNMSSWRAQQQPFAPRLLIQLSDTIGGAETPFFSFDYEKPETGILPKYWKNWNPFWANRLPVSGEFDFPVNQLRHLIYNICEKYRTREGEFLIEEMSCELYVDRISTTTIKGFKVE